MTVNVNMEGNPKTKYVAIRDSFGGLYQLVKNDDILKTFDFKMVERRANTRLKDLYSKYLVIDLPVGVESEEMMVSTICRELVRYLDNDKLYLEKGKYVIDVKELVFEQPDGSCIISNAVTDYDLQIAKDMSCYIYGQGKSVQLNFLSTTYFYPESNYRNSLYGRIFNYTFDANVNETFIPGLTFIKSAFIAEGKSNDFINVSGVLIRSYFYSSTITNLKLSVGYLDCVESSLENESSSNRHYINNIRDLSYFMEDSEHKYKFRLKNANLWVHNETQDIEESGLNEEEGVPININVVCDFIVEGGSAVITGRDSSCYSTLRTDPRGYSVNLTGMDVHNINHCIIDLKDHKNSTVINIGYISLFVENDRTSLYPIYLYKDSSYSTYKGCRTNFANIYVKYDNVALTLETLLQVLKRNYKDLYKLNRNIIKGYIKSIPDMTNKQSKGD